MLSILARDDCFSYRLRDALLRAGCPSVLACYDPKIPSYIVLDALAGIRADPAIVEPWLTNPCCFPYQKAMYCLSVTNADLIIIGSFSDLTIKGYQHRTKGWKFFEVRSCLDTAAVDAACVRLDLLSIDEIVVNNLKLFAHFLKQNPRAKALWINYPYINGASTEWDDSRNPIENRVMQARWQALTHATTATFPTQGIHVLNIPDDKVQRRDSNDLLWHYHDSTYDWAARAVLDWLSGQLC